MTTRCSLHRQMVLPESSANVRNYNNPAGMKRGDRAEYSGESKLATALHSWLWLLITVVTCGWAHCITEPLEISASVPPSHTPPARKSPGTF